MKPILRLDFCDFWDTFNKADNFLTRALSSRFQIEIVESPDILIYSDMGQRHRLATCRKVFYTCESLAPNFRECDYALTSFYPQDRRSYRLAYYTITGTADALIKAPDETETVPPQKTDFCSFVVSQDHGKKTANRIAFFHRLSRYKKVNSGGRMLNNIGQSLGPRREDKLNFLRRHKFMIAFENGRFPGYATEKLADALEARCIPIYWGDPEIARDFNPKSFVNVSDFQSIDHAIARIVEIDNDPALYRSILAEPYFHQNRPNSAFDTDPLCDFFETIRSDTSRPIASGGIRSFFKNWNRWTVVKRNKIWQPSA